MIEGYVHINFYMYDKRRHGMPLKMLTCLYNGDRRP